MNNYELTVIVRSRDAESHIEKVKEILGKHGVAVQGDNSPGVKRLAYQIEGESEGHYLFLVVEAQPDTVKKVIADFRLNNNILRYLFVKMLKKATA